MNYIDLLFAVIFLVMVFEGYIRGFAVSLLTLLRTAVSFPASFMISSFYSSDLYNAVGYRPIYDSLTAKIDESGLESTINGINDFISGLPYGLSERLTPYFDFLNGSDEEIAAGLMSSVINPVAVTVTKGIVFILCLILFYIAFAVVIKYFKKKNENKDAPLHKTNRFLGAFFGLVKAVIFVLCASAVLYFICSVSDKNTFVNEIETSLVYNHIKNWNPIIGYLL